jgi:capsid protein
MLKANYSNSRLAFLEFRRRIEAYQHAVIVWQLCCQVWARWMDTAVLASELDLPSYDQRRREYLACGWLPPKWDWVDPLKDARAEIEQIDAGLKSGTQALAERGYDAEQVNAEIAVDKAREQSLGLEFSKKPQHLHRPPAQRPMTPQQKTQSLTMQPLPRTRMLTALYRQLRRGHRSADSSSELADTPNTGSRQIHCCRMQHALRQRSMHACG